MIKLKRLGFFCVLALFYFTEKGRCEPAISQEFETYMLQHHYGAMAMDQDDRVTNQQTVDAKINGRKVTLIVDTGCERTALTEGCARRLGLDVHDAGFSDWGVGGKIQGNMGMALIQSFTLGGCEINRTNTIQVFPKTAHVLGGDDGLLGLDYLRLNAVILPVAGSGFLLKPGPTPVVSINDYMTKLGYKAVHLSHTEGMMMVEAHINGSALNMLVDSGAAFTTFDLDSVQAALGRKIPSAPGLMEGVDGAETENYRFVPKELDFGGFNLAPLLLMATKSPSFKKHGFAGFLGQDLLGYHRGIIDLGDDILWMK